MVNHWARFCSWEPPSSELCDSCSVSFFCSCTSMELKRYTWPLISHRFVCISLHTGYLCWQKLTQKIAILTRAYRPTVVGLISFLWSTEQACLDSTRTWTNVSFIIHVNFDHAWVNTTHNLNALMPNYFLDSRPKWHSLIETFIVSVRPQTKFIWLTTNSTMLQNPRILFTYGRTFIWTALFQIQ